MRRLSVTGVEPPKPGLSLVQRVVLKDPDGGVPVDTDHFHATVACQLVNVERRPSRAEHRSNEQNGRETCIVEIRRRRISHLELGVIRCLWEP
jgi:hypothetical protein